MGTVTAKPLAASPLAPSSGGKPTGAIKGAWKDAWIIAIGSGPIGHAGVPA